MHSLPLSAKNQYQSVFEEFPIVGHLKILWNRLWASVFLAAPAGKGHPPRGSQSPLCPSPLVLSRGAAIALSPLPASVSPITRELLQEREHVLNSSLCPQHLALRQASGQCLEDECVNGIMKKHQRKNGGWTKAWIITAGDSAQISSFTMRTFHPKIPAWMGSELPDLWGVSNRRPIYIPGRNM